MQAFPQKKSVKTLILAKWQRQFVTEVDATE